ITTKNPMPTHRYRNLLMAALVVSVIWSTAAVPESAAPSSLKQDRTAPRVMSEAAAQAEAPYTGPVLAQPTSEPATPLYGARSVLAPKATPEREVFGFVNAGNLTNATYGYTTWNYNLLTT